MKEQSPFAGQVLGVVLVIVLALAARFRGFRVAATVASGLLAFASTGLALVMFYWGFTRKDAGALVLFAMLVSAVSLVPWVTFFALRATARSEASSDASQATRSP